MFYKTCPFCGAHLDPGEPCDCHKHKSCESGLPPEIKASNLSAESHRTGNTNKLIYATKGGCYEK